MDENSSLDIKDQNKKEQGEYIVTGCIRWMGEVIKKSLPKSTVIKALREENLVGTPGHIPLRFQGNHTSKKIENQWFETADIAIRKYYGNKLSRTPMSIFEEIEIESTLYWSHVDILNYLNHEKIEKQKFFNK